MDTQFVSNKSLTVDCELDLGCGNTNFVCDTPSHFVYLYAKFD